ncbi:hypothetical protein D1007_46702 [Hordeum vulgare]|nr:hypothetical protein D1007_46702 [Hordeum vulgare]
MEFVLHPVETHMRKTDLMVVYTSDSVMVENSINTMERLLAEDDKYKVLGFDLSYTSCRDGHDQKVVVAKFVNCPDYMFSMVVTTNDPNVLKTLGLACQKFVDIRDHYNIWGRKKDMESYVGLAKSIIDPYYRGMIVECVQNKPTWHRAWVKSLGEHHIQTVAKEAYT